MVLAGGPQRLVAVRRRHHLEAREAERGGEEVEDVGLVVDDEEARLRLLGLLHPASLLAESGS